MNYDQQNTTSDNQEDEQNPLEHIQVRSEEVRNGSEQNAETFGSVLNKNDNVRNEAQNGSEENDKRSESFGTSATIVPKDTIENLRTTQNCSEDDTEHTITVREAARIFEEAGVPRTERALTNWCNVNSRGITRLNCCYRESQRRYYITPQSIDNIIKEERNKLLHRGQQNQTLFSSEAEALTEHVRNETQNGSEENDKRSEEVRNGSEQNAETFGSVLNKNDNVRNEAQNGSEENDNQGRNDKTNKDAFKELQMENYNLKVQLEGQKYLVKKFDELVDGERERHEKEKLALIDRLTDARHQIGSLEEKLLQIEAPKGVVHGGETEASYSEH